MPSPSFILLYVDNPTVSAAFYTGLLGLTPVEASPAFVMYVLESGVKLGLWSRDTVEPSATLPGGGELAFCMENPAAVDTLHRDWQARGLTLAQPPTAMDFGYTFVALDPDGHRLRVYTPGAC